VNLDLASAGSWRRACRTHSARAPLEISSWHRRSRRPTCHWACRRTNRLSQGQFEFRKSAREQGLSARAPDGLFFLWISHGAFWRRALQATLNWWWCPARRRPRLHPYWPQRATSGPSGSLFACAWVSLNKLRETLRSPQVYYCWLSAGTTPARNTVKTRSSWRRSTLNTTFSPAFNFLTAAR
jgi:hypothetical protein